MRTVSLLFVCICLMLGSVHAQTKQVAKEKPSIDTSFPLEKLAGLDGKGVEAILGKPTWEKTKHGPRGIYLDGAVDIVFIKNKADWIGVTPTKPLKFASDSITKYLGLAWATPSFKNKFTIRWELKGFRSMSAFPRSENRSLVDNIYIRVYTE